MRNLRCPSCGTPFVRVTYHQGTVERILTRFKIFPFRCQLCTTRFRTLWPMSPNATQVVDRRQYRRLPTSFHANLLADNSVRADSRVTDISMGGCALETTEPLPRGTFLELMITPAAEEEAIKVETAMVCSLRAGSMGIRFLELLAKDKHRLSQVILSLLVGQNVHPHLLS